MQGMNRSSLGQLLFAFCVFILPLSGALVRLLHPGPWIGFVAGFIILATQPSVTREELKKNRQDRGSVFAIFIAVIGSQLVAIIDFGYRAPFRPAPFSAIVMAGTALAAGGLALRLWAINVLGRFFTSVVMVQAGQTVVEDGPYRLLRHPSYSGALLTALGVVVTLGSVVGGVLVVLLAVPAYSYRIQVEERELMAGLGDPYRAYQGRTWRLLPYIY
jgi:protein-S-isoprenylcysteine O-methyltransferase Ste14